jgi:hypothetical protein
MTLLRYPFAYLSVVLVVGVLATMALPLFALMWLVLFFALAFVGIVTAGWGIAAGLRAIGRLCRRELAFVRASGDPQAEEASPFGGAPDVIRHDLLRSPAPAERVLVRHREPDTMALMVQDGARRRRRPSLEKE